jgi:hypothetical protein
LIDANRVILYFCHMESSDPELLYASKKPDIDYLQGAFSQTQDDLGEWLDRRQRDWEVRNCQWPGKSSDFKKHVPLKSTGTVFPWDGASDQDVRLADELIGCRVAQCMSAVRRAHIVASPVESSDVGRAGVVSAFLRWLINSKMDEWYEQVELSLNHLFEQGLAVTYVYWDSHDLKQQQAINLEEIAQAMPQIAEAILDGSLDEELGQMLRDEFNVSKAKAKAMLRELREAGETTVPVTRQVINQPRIKALSPSEDVFWPSWTIDPNEAPYVFHVIRMTPEMLKGKAAEGWDSKFIDAAIESMGAGGEPQVGNAGRLRDGDDFMESPDQTLPIVYMYQRLLDEDGTVGIYCTVFCDGLPDLYAKHTLLDYGHGQFPYICTKLEETNKRLYSSRSYPELVESLQQVLKVETDAAIDRQSLATLPPMLYPLGRPPSAWGPGVKVPYRVPNEVSFADTPRFDTGNVEIRRYVKEQADRFFGRNAPGVDPTEAMAKQQATVDKVFSHLKHVLDQVFTLYQQYGPDAEFFRVTGVNDVQKYSKGPAGERYDFWLSFDVATQDPEMMVERVKAIAELGGMLDKSGVLDTEQLLLVAAEQILPGAAERIMLPKETASARAMEGARQAITEVYSGVPPNVNPGGSHEIELQMFQQWLQQPDIAQKVQTDPALQERIETHLQQLQMQIVQKRNAEIGRLGTAPTPYGETAAA